MHHVHPEHLALLVYAVLVIALNLIKWPFVAAALSDGTSPSSTRIGGYIFVNLVAFCELYHTIRADRFDTTHLLYILISIGVLFGFIKVSDLLAARFGQKQPTDNTKQS